MTEITNDKAVFSSAQTRVIDTLARMLRREPSSLRAENRVLDDLGLDSTSILELLMELEDAFDIEFDPDTFEPRHFETIETLAEYVVGQAGDKI